MSDDAGDTDDLILNLLKENDARGLSLMFNAYYKPAYNSVKKIIGNGDDAKDIVLELFHAVWDKRHSLNLTKPLRNYLLAAAGNRALNYLRDKRRTDSLLNSVISMSASGRAVPPVDVDMQARELKYLIKAAIALLPQKPRITFLLSRDFRMTYKEIAAHLNVTEKAVEKNMTKALRLLKKFLGPYLT